MTRLNDTLGRARLSLRGVERLEHRLLLHGDLGTPDLEPDHGPEESDPPAVQIAEPMIVDFGGAPAEAPIAGLDQWLASTEDRIAGVKAVTGPQRVMVLRVYFKDYPANSRFSQVEVEGIMDQIDQLFGDISYGNMSIDDQVSSLFQLPKNRSDYFNANGGLLLDDLLSDAINNAPTGEGLDWNNLDGVMAVMAETDPAVFYPGLGGPGRSLPQSPGSSTMKVIAAAAVAENPGESERGAWGRMAHEFGHEFQQRAGDPWHPSNYKSEFELMDHNYPGQIGVFGKQDHMTYPGWMPPSKYQEFDPAGGGGLASIWAMEYDPSGMPNIQAVKAKITSNLYYLISVRRRVLGDDLHAHNTPNGIPDEGVLIERVVEGANQWVTVQGKAGDRDKLWQEGDVYTNLADGISIEVEEKTDEDNYLVYVRYNPEVAFFPDVGLHPWTSPPGNTWETTDIWFDSPLNGYNTYRYGTWNDLSGNPVPRGNGDPPAVGLANRVYARVRNMGTSTATDVTVRFEITDPLGVGIAGANGFVPLGQTDKNDFPGLASIAPGDFIDVYIEWTPNVDIPEEDLMDGLFAFHTCVRVSIDPVAGETVLGNQDGDREQENIFDFQAVPPSEGGSGAPLEHVIRLRNDDPVDSKYFYLSVDSNLPEAWTLDVGGGNYGMLLGPNEVVEIPITIQPAGPAVLGSTFDVDVTASSQIVLVSDKDPNDEHYFIEPFGGVHVAARVLRRPELEAEAEPLGEEELQVFGRLNVEDFDEFYDPENPLRVMIVGRDSDGRFLPATAEVLTVWSDATFDGFLEGGVLDELADVMVLFAGTDMLASAASSPIVVQGVAGRHIFYNNSNWDDPLRERVDDDAIAPDKAALLPGGTATFDNYTSYSRGINGIMVDIANPAGTITAADFEFKAGNDDNPVDWDPYLAVPAVTVRPGEGTGGSDRVTLIWPDYDPNDPFNTAVAKQWLQVTVLPNRNTGLDQPDVFYFGNAIGETDDSTTDAIVNVQDILRTRANPQPFWDPALIDSPYDFDRDERVDVIDILTARANQTWSFTALELIDPSGGKTAGSKVSVHNAVVEQAVVRAGNRRGTSSAKLAWLYEFESTAMQHRPSHEDDPVEQAVDKLWAMYWP